MLELTIRNRLICLTEYIVKVDGNDAQFMHDGYWKRASRAFSITHHKS